MPVTCLGAKPRESGGADCRELVVVEQPDAAADHAEDPAGEHDPCLGVGVALGDDRALGLAVPNEPRDEVVHLAHVLAERLPELGILRGMGWSGSGLYVAISNRGLVPPFRTNHYGLRVCADLP